MFSPTIFNSGCDLVLHYPFPNSLFLHKITFKNSIQITLVNVGISQHLLCWSNRTVCFCWICSLNGLFKELRAEVQISGIVQQMLLGRVKSNLLTYMLRSIINETILEGYRAEFKVWRLNTDIVKFTATQHQLITCALASRNLYWQNISRFSQRKKYVSVWSWCKYLQIFSEKNVCTCRDLLAKSTTRIISCWRFNLLRKIKKGNYMNSIIKLFVGHIFPIGPASHALAI